MLKEKAIKICHQLVKFGIVGVLNVAINLAIYYIMLYLGFHYIIAYSVGFIVSIQNAYFWNSRYVFKNKTEDSELRAFLKVFMSYGLSFCLSIALMSIFVRVLGISEYIAPILKLVTTIPLNFAMNKLWAFKDK